MRRIRHWPLLQPSLLNQPSQPIPYTTTSAQAVDPTALVERRLCLCRSVNQARPLLSQLIVTGSLNRAPTLRLLLDFLVHSLDQALSIRLTVLLSSHYFHREPRSTTFLYNILIRAYSNSRWPGESIAAFARMLRISAVPNHFTLPFVIKASATRKSPCEGGVVHCQGIKRGLECDVYVINTLISMFCVFSEMTSARKVFELNREYLDVVSWNTIIDGYVKAADLETARKLFETMPVKNEVSWSAMASGFAGSGQLDIAQSFFNKMPAIGRNVVTWNSMISGFSRHGLLPLARKFFDEMPVRNLVSWNSMVSAYTLNGDMISARELFEKMPKKNVISWSSMISGYVHTNQYREALDLFKEMQMDSQVKSNEVTMVSVLSACSHLAALDQGKWVHAYIDGNRLILDDDHNLGAALIDMYSKCGQVDVASEVFWKLGHKNVSAWNALISGLAINGLAAETLEAFQKMQVSGTKPDNVTFLGILIACTHGGLVDMGRQFFKSMSTVYGIKPDIKHYGCLVDLLGRSGLLQEAEDAIRDMPMKPDVMVLGALLAACRVYKNVEIADRLREQILQLNPQESGCHMLLSNIYAAAGRWADASNARLVMKKKGIRKEAAYSYVEVNGIIHEFTAGDCSHPQTTLIHSWLDEMCVKFKSDGYVPATEEVLLELSEEDKETWILRHSEKLAIAFAVLTAKPNSTIRIVKNLRICRDCHSFMKHVSRSFSHEILVRDRIRFHHFKGNFCSCNDFW